MASEKVKKNHTKTLTYYRPKLCTKNYKRKKKKNQQHKTKKSHSLLNLKTWCVTLLFCEMSSALKFICRDGIKSEHESLKICHLLIEFLCGMRRLQSLNFFSRVRRGVCSANARWGSTRKGARTASRGFFVRRRVWTH